MTLDEVRDALGAFEPDYPRLASDWGTAGLPHLRELVAAEDWGLAAKAAYVAALIGDVRTVQIASTRPNQYVRVAAAGAAPDLGFNDSTAILRALSNDPDPRVNGVAQRIAATNTRFNHLTRRLGNLTSRVQWFGRSLPGFRVFVFVLGVSLLISAYLAVFGPALPRQVTGKTTNNGTGTTDGVPEVAPLPAPPIK